MLLELESSESERFDGWGHDGPAKVVAEEEDEEADVGDLCSREAEGREWVEELALFTMLGIWSNPFRCLGTSCGSVG